MPAFDIQQAMLRLVDQIDLSRDEMKDVMRQIMSGSASDAQIGAFLMAMRLKGESIDEITGAVEVMRELASGVAISGDYLVDIVGTGGDGANLFNVSTASCFVVAAAGGRVAKHGNRSVSSNSGSADVLETGGLRLDLNPEQVARCVDQLGIGFMFAPAHHSAMKYAIGPRKELAVRTIFNILGPMTNPAGVKRLLIGVFSGKLCRPMAEALQRLGAEHVMVVHAADGLDEISIASSTHIAEARAGEIHEYQLKPEDLGISSQSLIGLEVAGASESLALIKAALSGETGGEAGKAAAMIALNAGAAIYVAGLVDTLRQGVEQAVELIGSGVAWRRFEQLVELSQTL